MKRLHRVADDFEALIRIYTAAEGGRQSPPFNGIRWDFAYADDPPAKDLFMIHPDFYDERGNSLPIDKPLPLSVEIPARMVVLNDELRITLHRLRITDGTRFYCHEGARRVAEGESLALLGFSPTDHSMVRRSREHSLHQPPNKQLQRTVIRRYVRAAELRR